MSNPTAKFLDGSIMRHVVVMSFTASIGLMAIFAVDLVDMIFISMLGNAALAAAVGYAGAILFFTNSFNIGLSIAAGALVSREIGANNTKNAREYATSVAMFTVLMGLIIPVLVLLNLDGLLGLLGATGEVADLATRYIRIILPSMAVIGLAMTGMAILRAYGDAKRSMLATLFGGIVNAVLDPIFIFALSFGLEGAAIASVFARCAMMLIAMYYAISRFDALARPSISMLVRDMRAVLAIAIPAVLTSVATPLGAAIVTREMAKFGTDAVAGMAVIGRVIPVAFAVIFALSGAIGPIIGQNFGAGNTPRVYAAFIDGIKFIVVYVLLVSAILFFSRGFLANVFEAEGLTRSLIFLFCGPLALTYIFNGMLFVANATFNNLGHASYSTWINWGKNTIGTLPFVLAGAALYGAQGILIGQALGSAIFGIIAAVLAVRVINKPPPDSKARPFQAHRRLHTIFLQRHH